MARDTKSNPNQMVPHGIKYMEQNIDMKRRKLFFAVVGPGSDQFQRWENFNDSKKLFRAIYESTKQGTITSTLAWSKQYLF